METLIGRKFDPYSDDDPWVYANRERLYEAVKDETAVEPNGWMLDAGCGDGSFSSHLRNCLGTIVGIDLSILALRSSRTVSPRLCVVRCHSGYLPFRDASFSRVLSKDMLHHIRDPSRGTEELSRVLEPASSLIIIEGNRANPIMALFTKYGGHCHFNSQTLVGLLRRSAIGSDLKVRQLEAHPYYAFFRPGKNPILTMWDASCLVFMVIVRRLPSVIRPFLSLESIFERVGARLGLASFNIIVSRRILENKPSDHTLGPVLAWDKNTATEK